MRRAWRELATCRSKAKRKRLRVGSGRGADSRTWLRAAPSRRPHAVLARGFFACPIGFTLLRLAGSLGRASIFSDSLRAIGGVGFAECGLSSEGVRVVEPSTFLMGFDLPCALRRPETLVIRAPRQ